MKYKVEQRVTLHRTVEVEADCLEEAEENSEDYEIQDVGGFTSVGGEGWQVYDSDCTATEILAITPD